MLPRLPASSIVYRHCVPNNMKTGLWRGTGFVTDRSGRRSFVRRVGRGRRSAWRGRWFGGVWGWRRCVIPSCDRRCGFASRPADARGSVDGRHTGSHPWRLGRACRESARATLFGVIFEIIGAISGQFGSVLRVGRDKCATGRVLMSGYTRSRGSSARRFFGKSETDHADACGVGVRPERA